MLHCEDGSASKTDGRELHRFVNDDHLLSCLEMLASDGKLRTLDLAFKPKRKLTVKHLRFLDTLMAVKADNVNIVKSPGYYGAARHLDMGYMDEVLKSSIPRVMTRRTKLFRKCSADEDEDKWTR